MSKTTMDAVFLIMSGGDENLSKFLKYVYGSVMEGNGELKVRTPIKNDLKEISKNCELTVSELEEAQAKAVEMGYISECSIQ